MKLTDRVPHSDDLGLLRITHIEGTVYCPNPTPHAEHTNAVWFDWNQFEVYTCTGQKEN